MSDLLDDYQKSVRKKLCGTRGDGDPFVQILCFPSFSPETVLQIQRCNAGTTLRLRSFESNYWWAFSGTPAADIPCFEEDQDVADGPALKFWNLVDELKSRITIGSEVDEGGLDGMTVEVTLTTEDCSLSFQIWSPNDSAARGTLVHSVLRMGEKVLKERRSQGRIKELQGYL